MNHSDHSHQPANQLSAGSGTFIVWVFSLKQEMFRCTCLPKTKPRYYQEVVFRGLVRRSLSTDGTYRRSKLTMISSQFLIATPRFVAVQTTPDLTQPCAQVYCKLLSINQRSITYRMS
eukprot:468103-Pelagomonas_calceolata.AAC.2